ncbi:hypothetical protein NW754_011627 [Fusarium falciforme]|uniref:N-acetyltransferase domain-containing protein n=1 Tax=Fusarium falciforme TaxID=195108 RepID=A0A9W8R6T3_9HYPO|nr:hypothetical protein NW754_011627 [Fusarium falciforme]KAJ4187965.1 hypothetical protein NW755_006760 [Fusarium falciforme]KAJ4198546.1 hypothetical protein NW767_008922 [Fusarium falciforme]
MSSSSSRSQTSSAALLWDHQDLVPIQNILADEELVLLLTPAVVPLNTNLTSTSDPFEPLGRALARRHPWIRHVPYVKDRGITGTHVAFIKRARVVIFMLAGFSSDEGAFQLEVAGIVREVCEERPTALVACCQLPEDGHDRIHELGFQTVLQCPGYSAADLETIAALLTNTTEPAMDIDPEPQALWPIQPWNYDRDLPEVHMLWLAALPPKFHLSRAVLGSLLKRDGYAMHHIIREPSSGRIVGFCATFTTFADSSGDRLIGSIAAIIAHQDFRGRGIGRMLHDEVLSKLNKIRGVGRIQIGSTFPRLLYGLPDPVDNSEWFENRGWKLNELTPGKGRPVSDWCLRFADSPVPDLASAGLSFRPCQLPDAHHIIGMANRESERKFGFGWYDQYAKTIDSCHLSDVIVGLEGDNLVAAAITYFPNNGSPCAADIPWPAAVGQDIGGVSCICIKDDDPDMVNRRDSVMMRLLLACRQSLTERGMVGMFVDGIKSDENVLSSLGFRKWAEYKEVWRKI